MIPSKGNAPYTTRVVNPDGSPATSLYGADLGFTVLGSGNPGDAGVSYGVVVKVLEVKSGNTAAKIHVVPPKP